MNMSKEKLNELIRLITVQVLKEYSSMSSTSSSPSSDPSGNSNDSGDKPAAAMTSYEKAKAERESKKKQQDNIRTATMDLKSTQKQQDYFSQQAKKNKLDIQSKEKQLQALKGATPQAAMIPAGGTVAENIRKLSS